MRNNGHNTLVPVAREATPLGVLGNSPTSLLPALLGSSGYLPMTLVLKGRTRRLKAFMEQIQAETELARAFVDLGKLKVVLDLLPLEHEVQRRSYEAKLIAADTAIAAAVRDQEIQESSREVQDKARQVQLLKHALLMAKLKQRIHDRENPPPPPVPPREKTEAELAADAIKRGKISSELRKSAMDNAVSEEKYLQEWEAKLREEFQNDPENAQKIIEEVRRRLFEEGM